jgi:hypothetical protein
VPEDAGAPAVSEQQRGEQADERRLAGPVLAQDGNALAAGDLEGQPVERGHTAAAAPVAADELLAQVVDFDRDHVLLLRLVCGHGRIPGRTGRPAGFQDSAEAQHRGKTVAAAVGGDKGGFRQATVLPM